MTRPAFLALTLILGCAISPGEVARRADRDARKAGAPGSVEYTVAYRRTAAQLTGQRELAALPPRRIELDATFRDNLRKTVASGYDVFIFHGTEVQDGEFDSTVAVKQNSGVVCTGFAIAPRKVVTAGHCVDLATAVAEGNDASADVPVIHGEAFPGGPDVGVLFLASDLKTTNTEQLATTSEIDQASSLRVVGFGRDHAGAMGAKAYGDVVIKSLRCDGANEPATWGCTSPYELVANNRKSKVDTCNGDSGGPAFIGTGASRRVAAIVRKNVKNGRNCIDGSIYTRADTAGLAEFLRDAKPQAYARISLR